MAKFDISKIPDKEWTHEDEKWKYGINLNPQKGVFFWGERHDLEDGGAYRMTFNEFLRTKEFSTPSEIIDEIRDLLTKAIIKNS